LEQAWIQKMAREIARKVREEKAREEKVREEKVRVEQAEARGREEKWREIGGHSDEVEAVGMSPPPAYGAV